MLRPDIRSTSTDELRVTDHHVSLDAGAVCAYLNQHIPTWIRDGRNAESAIEARDSDIVDSHLTDLHLKANSSLKPLHLGPFGSKKATFSLAVFHVRAIMTAPGHPSQTPPQPPKDAATVVHTK